MRIYLTLIPVPRALSVRMDIQSSLHQHGRQRLLSPIEKFVLLDVDFTALNALLRLCDPLAIHCLQRTSKTIENAVRLYCAQTWDVQSFIKLHFKDTNRFFDVMTRTGAIAFGIEVLRFFDRVPGPRMPFDVCVRYEGITEVIGFLRSQYYEYAGESDNRGLLWLENLTLETRRLLAEKLRSSGDRNAGQADRASIVLSFYRTDGSGAGLSLTSLLNVHVVRCDPYAHLLSLYGSKF